MKLQKQIEFLKEIDKLKLVVRQTYLVDESRRENTGEHSWHIAMATITLVEYADEPVDVLRVLKMLLVHDIVEIDAGDTFAFDETGYEDKSEREQKAAERIFGMLPDEQNKEFMAYWKEFEAVESNDSKFANAIDRLMPFLHNMWTEGRASWERHNISYEQAFKRQENGGAKESSAVLWEYVQDLLNRAVADGWLSAPE